MANLPHFQLVFVTLLLLFVAPSVLSVTETKSINFSFPPETDLVQNRDAFYEANDMIIQLNRKVNSISSGLVSYNKSIPLWDDSSDALANFTTHFQFVISKENGSYEYGDGMAFFMVPFDLALEPIGGRFGLFNDSTYTSTPYDVVAVEFDTFQDEWDVDDNHVGIDVKNIFSGNISRVSFADDESKRPDNENLKNGKKWDAWVDYDGGAKLFRVFLLSNPQGGTNAPKPRSPIVVYHIDLRHFLPKNVRVGLSASIVESMETHTVYFWDFCSKYSWENSSQKNTSFPDRASPATKHVSVMVILISVPACLFSICVFIFVGGRWYFRKGKLDVAESDLELDEWFAQGPHKFSYEDLCAATRNFSDDQKLGQGGFGGVYRGILPGATEAVAVKRISRGSKQGKREYVSEVSIISKLRHRNLVQLLGWCHQKGELLLVYEFLPNGSLDMYLFGELKATLDWNRRYSIACDIASALVYLHEEWDQRVVHRDVKASNIMLDAKFNGKLGDFGLARLVGHDQEASHTTVVAGTMGYLAPECVVSGKASPESDAYSFGALALSIACGRPPLDRKLRQHNCRLVEWVWDLYGQGKLLESADERLDKFFDGEEMERLMLVGLLCSHPEPKARLTMREAVKILKFEVDLPNVPLSFPVLVYTDSNLSSWRTLIGTSSTITCSGVSLSSISSSAENAYPDVTSPSTGSSTPSRPLL